jgi:hypothetical protein
MPVPELILKNPDFKDYYDLDKYSKEIQKIKWEQAKTLKRKDNIKGAISTFEEYLKLLETTSIILGKNT